MKKTNKKNYVKKQSSCSIDHHESAHQIPLLLTSSDPSSTHKMENEKASVLIQVSQR